eukprot:Opistho-2@46581
MLIWSGPSRCGRISASIFQSLLSPTHPHTDLASNVTGAVLPNSFMEGVDFDSASGDDAVAFGVHDLVVSSAEEYVRRGVQLGLGGTGPSSLSGRLSATLKEAAAHRESSIVDAEVYAHNLSRLFKELARRHREGLEPVDVDLWQSRDSDKE